MNLGFTKKKILSIILLLACIFISLVMSDVPFLISNYNSGIIENFKLKSIKKVVPPPPKPNPIPLPKPNPIPLPKPLPVSNPIPVQNIQSIAAPAAVMSNINSITPPPVVMSNINSITPPPVVMSNINSITVPPAANLIGSIKSPIPLTPLVGSTIPNQPSPTLIPISNFAYNFKCPIKKILYAKTLIDNMDYTNAKNILNSCS